VAAPCRGPGLWPSLPPCTAADPPLDLVDWLGEVGQWRNLAADDVGHSYWAPKSRFLQDGDLNVGPNH
jgi:hypothetical protein